MRISGFSMSGRGWLCGFDRMGRRVRAEDNEAKPMIHSLGIDERGAYAAPISPETTEHTPGRVGTQWDENPMDARVSAIAGDRAGSLGMAFRGLAAKSPRLEVVGREGVRETTDTTRPFLVGGTGRVR